MIGKYIGIKIDGFSDPCRNRLGARREFRGASFEFLNLGAFFVPSDGARVAQACLTSRLVSESETIGEGVNSETKVIQMSIL